jgi:hypothetical protein
MIGRIFIAVLVVAVLSGGAIVLAQFMSGGGASAPVILSGNGDLLTLGTNLAGQQ